MSYVCYADRVAFLAAACRTCVVSFFRWESLLALSLGQHRETMEGMVLSFSLF